MTIFVINGFSQTRISSREARDHIGDTVTILDGISEVQVLYDGTTVLQLGDVSPDEQVLIMINAKDRTGFKFEQLTGKQVIVSRRLIDNKGKPTIQVTHPEQLSEIFYNDFPKKSPGQGSIITPVQIKPFKLRSLL